MLKLPTKKEKSSVSTRTHSMLSINILMVLLVFFVCYTPLLLADTIILKDGRKIIGIIMRENEQQIQVKRYVGSGEMTVTYDRNGISKIIKDPDQNQLIYYEFDKKKQDNNVIKTKSDSSCIAFSDVKFVERLGMTKNSIESLLKKNGLSISYTDHDIVAGDMLMGQNVVVMYSLTFESETCHSISIIFPKEVISYKKIKTSLRNIYGQPVNSKHPYFINSAYRNNVWEKDGNFVILQEGEIRGIPNSIIINYTNENLYSIKQEEM